MTTERIPEGQDVLPFLEAHAPEGAWVNAVGTLTGAVLSVPAGEGEATRPIAGPVRLLSLMGPAAGPLMAVVATGEGAVLGGRLVSGVAADVCFELSAQGAPRPAAAAKPPPAAATDDDEADEAPKYGDRVDHFVFGLCDVMVVREERMKIRDASGHGRLREIHLRAVKVLKPTVEDRRRVFKLARRGG